MILDPITTEVIGHYLLAVAEEMGVALVKSAYSVNIKERADCSTVIFTASGETAAQAAYQPIHLGSTMFLVDEIRRRYPEEAIRPGDMFIANDPYSGGGSHLMDLAVAAPVIVDGRLIAWVGTIAHHSDVGGRVPASQAQDNTSIYQEGIRLPAVRIFEQGRLCEELLAVILLNSRLPEERAGDLRAQFAANLLAVEKLTDLVRRYGGDVVCRAMVALLDANERAFRAALSALPPGSATFTEYMDDDGIGEEPVAIRVRVTLRDGEAHLDFTGSDPQGKGARNLVLSGLYPTCYYTLKAIADPDLSANGGYFRAIRITAPEGTIVNARPPAATSSRVQTAQRVVDALLGALAQIVPDRVVAASHGGATITFSGIDPRTGRRYTHYEAIGGGCGATVESDGLDAIQVHITNTGNVPIEVFELEFPLLVDRYELVPDSGGAGRRRGGMGARRDIAVLRGEPVLNAMGDRQRMAPWGFAGGGSGSYGRFSLFRNGEQIALKGTTSNLLLQPGDVFSAQTSGGGGFGDPAEREPDRVADDLADERILSADRYRRQVQDW